MTKCKIIFNTYHSGVKAEIIKDGRHKIKVRLLEDYCSHKAGEIIRVWKRQVRF